MRSFGVGLLMFGSIGGYSVCGLIQEIRATQILPLVGGVLLTVASYCCAYFAFHRLRLCQDKVASLSRELANTVYDHT